MANRGAIFHTRALNCKNNNLQRTDNIFAAHETFLFINILILYRNLPRLQSYQSVCTWYCNTPSLLCKKWSRLHRKVSLIKTGFTNSKTGSWENFKFSKSHFRISHLLYFRTFTEVSILYKPYLSSTRFWWQHIRF